MSAAGYLLNESPDNHDEEIDQNCESKRQLLTRPSSNLNNRGSSSNKDFRGQYSSNGDFSNSANTVLCDMFLFCAKRLDEASRQDLIKVMPLDEEREMLNEISTHLMLEYLKQIVNYLVKSKVRLQQKVDEFLKPDEEYMNEYEGMIQQLEAKCRTHISVQQQLKIWAETAEENKELVEKERDAAIASMKSFQDQISIMSSIQKERDDRIDFLKSRVADLEEHVERLMNLNRTRAKIPPSCVSAATTTESYSNNNINQAMQIQQSESLATITDNLNSQRDSITARTITTADKDIVGSQQKRNQRSVSTFVSKNQHELNQQQNSESNIVSNYVRIVKEKMDSSDRLATEPMNLKSTSSTSRNQAYNISASTCNTYSQDALAFLLMSNSNHKQNSQQSHQQSLSSAVSSIHTRSVASTREEKKRMDKYLFDKGENKGLTERSYGGNSNQNYNNGMQSERGGISSTGGNHHHTKSAAILSSDLSKSSKNINGNQNLYNPSTSSRGNSGGLSGKSGPSISSHSSAATAQAVLIKAIQQQQIMKQVQNTAVLNRIQQKIQSNSSNQSQYLLLQQQQQLPQASVQSQAGQLNQPQQCTSSLITQNRPISRSKSRHRFKEEAVNSKSISGNGSSSGLAKEYNIYTVNQTIQQQQPPLPPSHSHTKTNTVKQQQQYSPSKVRTTDSMRSLSVDAFSKQNSSKTSLTSK